LEIAVSSLPEETRYTVAFSRDPATQSLKLAQESLLHWITFLGGFGLLLILMQVTVLRSMPTRSSLDLPQHPPIVLPELPSLPDPAATAPDTLMPASQTQIQTADPSSPDDPQIAAATQPVPSLIPTAKPRLSPIVLPSLEPVLSSPPSPATLAVQPAPTGNLNATIRCFNKAGDLYYEGPGWGVSAIERAQACR
jgi:hypothetical protein